MNRFRNLKIFHLFVLYTSTSRAKTFSSFKIAHCAPGMRFTTGKLKLDIWASLFAEDVDGQSRTINDEKHFQVILTIQTTPPCIVLAHSQLEQRNTDIG